MYKLVFFVPSEDKEKVKDALFEAGAGRSGHYSLCSWECEGLGQFMPGEGSQPALGQVSELATVKEYRVEMLVPDELLIHCSEALRLSHPYEEPAFEFIKIVIPENDTSGEEWL